MPKQFIKTFIISLIIVFLIALTGSLVQYDSQWYQENKPSFTPPDYLFGIVWPVLYALIALSIALAWTSSSRKQKPKIITLYAMNLIANALWTWLFFSLKLPLISLIDILVILTTTAWLMLLLWKTSKRASLLLLPYFLWVLFASALNVAFL
jgi:translocator protein